MISKIEKSCLKKDITNKAKKSFVEDYNINSKIRELLRKYKPSKLDELLTVCPFFKAGSENTSAYRFIHDLATSRILARLQLKLDSIAIASEVPLEFGRANGVASSKMVIANGDSPIALIEVKTGRLKLVQPAVYTYFNRVKTLVAELKTGEVIVIDVETAEKLIEELVKHIADKERLKVLGKRIPSKECVYCSTDCEFRSNSGGRVNPLKPLPKILNNIEVIVEKILSEVAREIRWRKTGTYNSES